MDHFYRDLPPFDNFDEVTESHHFRTVPDSWTIFVTDVQNSTDAIRNGKYRDVNLIGASTVAMARNVTGTLDFPFTFGGDGAVLLMPPEHDEALRGRLCGLRNLADRHFDLILRVGAVPVKDVSDRSLALKVARYRLTPGTCVGIFRGDGIAYAEQQVKRNNASYRLSVNNPPEVDLSALSCRWKPIPSKRDTVLSLLVIARNDHERSTYQRILNELNRLYDGDLNRGNPVNTSDMSYRSVGDCYRDEKRYTENRWSLSYLFRLLEIVFAVALFRWKIPFYFVDAEHYRNALPEHSDYRKFDGMLRLTIDCSTEQLEEIIEILDEMHRNDRVFYGHHASSEALMTCFVENLNDGGHIHFIDGGNGGYAMAAIQLKQQVDRARENGKETESIRKRII